MMFAKCEGAGATICNHCHRKLGPASEYGQAYVEPRIHWLRSVDGEGNQEASCEDFIQHPPFSKPDR